MRPGTLEKIIIPPSEDGITISPLNENDDKDTDGIAADHTKGSKEQRKKELLEEEERKRLSRKSKWDSIRFWIRITFIIATVLGAIAIPGTYLWHILAPSCWRWLPTSELQSIKDLAVTIITGVTVSVGVALLLGERELQK